jgi:hypothetical protein
MKKLLWILIGLILLAIASVYLFIPGKITISKSMTVQVNQNPLLRRIGNIQTWKEWWPGQQKINDTALTYLLNNIKFTPGFTKIQSVPLSIDAGDFTTFSELTFISLGIDSTMVLLEATIPVSNNPFKRLMIYFKSKELEKSLSAILQSINDTYTQTINLYGYNIQKKSVVDSILIFTSEEIEGRPSISKIYSMIDDLKNYIQKNAAEETGNPMLNITTADSINFLVKVAIPVNKKLPDSGKIHYRWMLGGGNILIAEVKGGTGEINKAYEQIRHYVSDYNRIAPAIPFESLVTDRRNEPDSSKWITLIYYPVM